MTVVETLLVLVAIPAAVYGLATLIALWPKLTRNRYRAGQDWNFDPVFWVADPASTSTAPEGAASARAAGTDRGGAHGNW